MRRRIKGRRERAAATAACSSVAALCAAALVVAVLAAGCGGSSRSGASTAATLLALLRGRLHYDPTTHCVWVGSSTRGTEVRWPPGYRVQTQPLRLLKDGRPIAGPNDRLRLGGGTERRLPATPRCRKFVQRDMFDAQRVRVVRRR